MIINIIIFLSEVNILIIYLLQKRNYSTSKPSDYAALKDRLLVAILQIAMIHCRTLAPPCGTPGSSGYQIGQNCASRSANTYPYHHRYSACHRAGLHPRYCTT